ncbi:MAG: DUF86 domain-containing protein [Chloroflexota bacterium]
MRDQRLYLEDILTAIESIETFVAGMDLETFQADDKTASAVIRKFEIIGEAARHVPEDIRTAYSKVAWKEMAGMRDRLIHFYMGVNYRLIWQTIKNDLPRTKTHIQRILKENPHL